MDDYKKFHPDGLNYKESWMCKGDPDCHEHGEPYHDRHGIYSGRACDKHARNLPGQGDMWNYEAEEPVEEEA